MRRKLFLLSLKKQAIHDKRTGRNTFEETQGSRMLERCDT